MKKTILIVEDNAVLAMELEKVLREENYQVMVADCGAAALNRIAGEDIDGCLLDIRLPDCSGLELCKGIRQIYRGPIIIMTGLDEEQDIIRGLDSGADDYVTKPFSVRILLSRIASQLRRQEWTDLSQVSCLVTGDLVIDLNQRMVYKNGDEIYLGWTEYQLCQKIAMGGGMILTRDMLLSRIWDERGEIVEDNTLSVHIYRLRRKLGLYHGESYIETLKGIGYRWNIPVTRKLEHRI